jgi:penicillin-binding protein 1A
MDRTMRQDGGVRRRWSALVVLLTLIGGACAYAPPTLDVAGPVLAQSTKIYAADGTLITTLLAAENREDVRFDDLPAWVPDAVVAIEDSRYWTHKGVDVRAILRAAVANTAEGEVVEGGSTITQQYVKNTLLDSDQTLDRKLEEAVLALQLERDHSKKRILELYLNTIFFGNGAYGVQAAAQEYFGVTARELTLAQAATLAGLIRAPSAFDPTDNPEAAVERRDHVVDRMLELGLVTDADAAAAKVEPLVLAERTVEERYPAAYVVEQAKQFVLDDPRFGATRGERQALLFSGGLRITTTVDLAVQAAAEGAVAQTLPDPATFPDAAVVTIEPGTGFVRALVGGRDFFSGGARAKLDLATGGPGRPSGSSFKPFVLAAALAEGIPLDRVYPAPSHLEIPLPDASPWRVENYEGSGGGEATLYDATVRSYNTVYAQLIQEVGPEDAMAVARALGVRTTELHPFPSAVLGTNDVHPLDMAAAYATFANRGLRVPPVFVTKVTRRDGTVLYQHQRSQERVLDQRVADQVTGVLQAVVERGTGVGAQIGRPVAGKTGTGQEWRDAWFVGYTPQLATAVWVGFADQGRRSMVPPATPFRVTGGKWPAQIWQLTMSAALAQTPVMLFSEPAPAPPPPPTPVTSVDLSLPRVRNVVGMPLATALELLAADGFRADFRDVLADDYPPGYVVAQTPGAATRASPALPIVLDVANGETPWVIVPDVLGLDAQTAARVLTEAGLTASVVEEFEGTSPGVDQRAGRVWRQGPGAGSVVRSAATVEVRVNPAVSGG